jgi:hypothetical protein
LHFALKHLLPMSLPQQGAALCGSTVLPDRAVSYHFTRM